MCAPAIVGLLVGQDTLGGAGAAVFCDLAAFETDADAFFTVANVDTFSVAAVPGQARAAEMGTNPLVAVGARLALRPGIAWLPIG